MTSIRRRRQPTPEPETSWVTIALQVAISGLIVLYLLSLADANDTAGILGVVVPTLAVNFALYMYYRSK